MDVKFHYCDDPECVYCMTHKPQPEPIGNYMGGKFQLVTQDMYDKVVAERDKALADAEYWRNQYHDVTGSWHASENAPQNETDDLRARNEAQSTEIVRLRNTVYVLTQMLAHMYDTE